MAEKPFDLVESWREMLRDWEKQTNAAMTGVSGSPEFAEMMGRSLAASMRLQSLYAEGLEKTLEKLNLPSRENFKQVYAQLAEIEARLDRLTAAVEALAPAERPAAPARPSPPRTRKPTPKAGG